MLSLFIQGRFTWRVDARAFKWSHWCTCRTRDTRRQCCCCRSPTAASIQDSCCTGLCRSRGWLQRWGGQRSILTSVSRHINEESKSSAHFLFRVIVNTYCTACWCRLCRSLRKWFLTCMGGCTGSSRCNVVQHVIQCIKDNKKNCEQNYIIQ